MLKTRACYHRDDLIELGNRWRDTKSAMRIMAICVAAVCCTKDRHIEAVEAWLLILQCLHPTLRRHQSTGWRLRLLSIILSCQTQPWQFMPAQLTTQDTCHQHSPQRKAPYLSWIQRGFKALFCRKIETPFGRLLWAIRFGLGGAIRPYLRFLACISDFRAVTLIFGRNSESFRISAPNHFSGVLQ